jgi:hypothetical protein
MAASDSDEEDYMSMAITEPTENIRETPVQRRARLKREAEIRGRPKSKKELEAEAAKAREEALQKSLFDTTAAKSKGLKMMAKMGFKPGEALGKKEADAPEAAGSDGNGMGGKADWRRKEPIMVEMKEDKGGIGLDSEKKRKFREAVEGEAKRVKADEGDYRERVRREREEARLEAQVAAAQRVAERMAGEWEEDELARAAAAPTAQAKKNAGSQPLKTINVLWRGLVRKREEKERDRRMRYDLHQSLSRLPTYEDTEEDKDDRKALGKDVSRHALVEDLEEEDPELEEFNALEPAERLEKLVLYLRQEFNYCFWCKYTYPDKEMEGCPGVAEEEHD